MDNQLHLQSDIQQIIDNDSEQIAAIHFNLSKFIKNIFKTTIEKDQINFIYEQFIQKENEVEKLIEKIIKEKSEDYNSLIDTSKFYGKQFENIRQNLNKCKRKIQRSKELISFKQNNEQIQNYYNQLYNKNIQFLLEQVEYCNFKLVEIGKQIEDNHIYEASQNIFKLNLILKENFKGMLQGTVVIANIHQEINKLEKKIKFKIKKYLKLYFFLFEQNLQLFDNKASIQVKDLLQEERQIMNPFEVTLLDKFNLSMKDYMLLLQKEQQLKRSCDPSDKLYLRRFLQQSMSNYQDFDQIVAFIKLSSEKEDGYQVVDYQSDGEIKLVNLVMYLKASSLEGSLENILSDFYFSFKQDLVDQFYIIVIQYINHSLLKREQQKESEQQNLQQQEMHKQLSRESNKRDSLLQSLRHSLINNSVSCVSRATLNISHNPNKITIQLMFGQIGFNEADDLTMLFRELTLLSMVMLRKNLLLQKTILLLKPNQRDILNGIDLQTQLAITIGLFVDAAKLFLFNQKIQQNQFNDSLQLTQIVSQSLDLQTLDDFLRCTFIQKNTQYYLQYPFVRQIIQELFNEIKNKIKNIQQLDCKNKNKQVLDSNLFTNTFDLLYENQIKKDFLNLVHDFYKENKFIIEYMSNNTEEIQYKELLFFTKNLDSILSHQKKLEEINQNSILYSNLIIYLFFYCNQQLQKQIELLIKKSIFETQLPFIRSIEQKSLNLKFWSSTLNYSLIQIKNEKNNNSNKVQRKLVKNLLSSYLNKKQKLNEQELITKYSKIFALLSLFKNQKLLLKQVIQRLNDSVDKNDLQNLKKYIEDLSKDQSRIFKDQEEIKDINQMLVQLNLNQQVFAQMDDKYLSTFIKNQSIENKDKALNLCSQKEEVLVCQLECIRQSSKQLLDLYIIIKFKVILDIMSILLFDFHDDRVHQLNQQQPYEQESFDKLVSHLQNIYDIYQQILDHKTYTEVFVNIFYYIYLFTKQNIICSKNILKGNLTRILKIIGSLDKQLDFIVLENNEKKEKSYYLNKLKWFIQVMTFTDDQFIQIIKVNNMKFSEKKLRKLIQNKQEIQRKKIDEERIEQLLQILKGQIQ